MTDEDLKRLLDANAAENRRHFDLVAEGLRSAIRVVAEGVINVSEKLAREADDIRGEMRQGFAEMR